MHVSKQGGWEITHDRDWHIYRDKQDLAVLRRLEEGELIAQVQSFFVATRQSRINWFRWKIFRKTLNSALAKNSRNLSRPARSVDEANRRVLRVVVRGTASDLPILWNYYHIADQQGRQMGFVFTFEEKYADRFGKADRELVDSLRFVEAKQ